VWRFRCADCGKTFTRLPPFLLPFKHYVVKNIVDFGSLKDSTIMIFNGVPYVQSKIKTII
jgi:hypothetical protein